MPALAGSLAAHFFALWLPGSAAALLLAACRCGPLLLAVPLLGLMGRAAALVLGTLLVAPLLAPAVAAAGLAGPPGAGTALLPLCARELLIGGTLTLAAALPWAVAHSVGALLDGGRRAGQAAGPERSRPAAQLYGALALALFFALGGARIVVTALAASYELLPLPTTQHPLAEPSLTAQSGQGLVLLSGRMLWLAVRLAVPLLGAQLLAELMVTIPGRWLGPAATGRRRGPAAVPTLIWLGVLLLGAHTLFPEFRQLLAFWPSLLRQALDAR